MQKMIHLKFFNNKRNHMKSHIFIAGCNYACVFYSKVQFSFYRFCPNSIDLAQL